MTHNKAQDHEVLESIKQFIDEYNSIRDKVNYHKTFGYMWWRTMANGKTIADNLTRLLNNTNVNRSYIGKQLGQPSATLIQTLMNNGYKTKRVYAKRNLIPKKTYEVGTDVVKQSYLDCHHVLEVNPSMV